MYTINWALNFIGFSKSEQMDLHKFVLFYDEYIADRNFIYTTTSRLLPSFVVESKRNQLPHLIGLQHWNNLPLRQPSKQYEFLKSGEWDLSFLEKSDAGSFQEYKARIEFLPYLYNFLYNYKCSVKLVNHTMRNPFRNRKIDMIFQKEGDKLVYVLELREKKAEGQHYVYVLTSMTVHNKKSSALRGKFVPLTVTDVYVESNKSN